MQEKSLGKIIPPNKIVPDVPALHFCNTPANYTIGTADLKTLTSKNEVIQIKRSEIAAVTNHGDPVYLAALTVNLQTGNAVIVED